MPAIEGHHDFAALEARLAELIREAKSGDPFAPVAVVAPTSRLVAHLQSRLSDPGVFPALIGVHFFTHASLAREAAAIAGAALPREAPRRVREAILRKIVRGSGGALATYAEDRPGATAAFLSTMDDLREAKLDPARAASAKGLSPRGQEVLSLYAAYAARLDDLARKGLSDRARIRLEALPHMAAFAKRFRLVVHYGAYELTGVSLDLMRAVEESGVRLVYLLPCHPESPAFEFARRFLAQALEDAAREQKDSAGAREAAVRFLMDPALGAASLLGDRLPFLYDEDAPALDPIAGGRIEFFHAQGADAELREVAMRILALVRDENLPLGRIAVIARSLEPYTPLLRPVFFDDHRIPFTTSGSLGALREASAQAVLHLARAALGEFERQPLMDLFRSGLFRLGGRDLAPEAHAWDRLSREFSVTRGYAMWTQTLPHWAREWEPYIPRDADEAMKERLKKWKEIRVRQAKRLAESVRDLNEAFSSVRKATGWRSWSVEMANACTTLLLAFAGAARSGDPLGREAATKHKGAVAATGADRGAGAALEILSEIEDLEIAGVPFTPDAALELFERALFEVRIPIGSIGPEGDAGSRDTGGVRVLDAMQARGLRFDAVFLIGFNADLFPQRAHEDPFLRDADREILRERAAPSIPIKTRRREEEHLLLAHLLGCARRRITISWQRADESGRARIPSLALREITRVAIGSPDLKRAEEAARRVAAHPADAGRDIVARFGLLPPEDARRNAALQIQSPLALLAATDSLPASRRAYSLAEVRAGLGMLAVVEEFSPADLRYDAFVGGAAARPVAWSPSRLETLGNCPQQYFFRHLLGVEELEEAMEGYEIDIMDLGLRVHAVLHDVYAELIRKGDLSRPGADPSRAARRGHEMVEDAWARHTADLAERMHARYPILWDRTSDLWKNALRTFVLHDVADLARSGARLIGLELEAPGPIGLGAAGGQIEIRGRFDRLARQRGGEVVVSDYKTAGKIENHVALAEILKGRRLQMPLYVLMAERLAASSRIEGAQVRAEALGVGPTFAAGTPIGGVEGVTGEASPGGPGSEEGYPSRATLDPAKFATYREGFMETLRVLVDLSARGSYPLNEKSARCGYCEFVRACRKSHTPTLTRLSSAPLAADYFALRGKSTRAPSLTDVRATAGGEESL